MQYPNSVRLVEVGPRDGLQNEATLLTAEDRVQLIELLSASGLTCIESGSFVSPKWVPQMANTSEVFHIITKTPGVRYSALTPNMRGLEEALAAGVDEVAVFAAVSESFSKTNINCSIAESMQRLLPVIRAASAAGLPVRGYLSCVLGCPYEGEVDFSVTQQLSNQMLEAGCYEVSLGDTIGVGTPASVNRTLEALIAELPAERIAVHFHDTYGQALANILVALNLGISVIDCAVAGLGGCPYARGASGNVATEDVLYMLDGLGVTTGVDLQKVLQANRFIMSRLDRPQASKAAAALLSREQH